MNLVAYVYLYGRALFSDHYPPFKQQQSISQTFGLWCGSDHIKNVSLDDFRSAVKSVYRKDSYAA